MTTRPRPETLPWAPPGHRISPPIPGRSWRPRPGSATTIRTRARGSPPSGSRRGRRAPRPNTDRLRGSFVNTFQQAAPTSAFRRFTAALRGRARSADRSSRRAASRFKCQPPARRGHDTNTTAHVSVNANDGSISSCPRGVAEVTQTRLHVAANPTRPLRRQHAQRPPPASGEPPRAPVQPT
jgi:hypothetical protein